MNRGPDLLRAHSQNIVVINVYKRFLFLDKNAFINVFLFFQRFLFLKNVERSAYST